MQLTTPQTCRQHPSISTAGENGNAKKTTTTWSSLCIQASDSDRAEEIKEMTRAAAMFL